MSGMEALAIPMVMGGLSGMSGPLMSGMTGGLSSLMAPLLGDTGSMFGNVIGGSSSTAPGAGMLGSFLPQLGKSALGGVMQGGLNQGFNMLGGGGQAPMPLPDFPAPPPVQIPSAPQIGNMFPGSMPAMPTLAPPGFGNTGLMGNMLRLGGPGSSMTGVPSFYLRNYR